MAHFPANAQIFEYSVMRYFIFLLLSLASLASYSQEMLMETEDVLSAEVLEPKFGEGDILAFYDYVRGKIDETKIARPSKVVASFSISAFGILENIRIIEFSDATSAAEIIRVLKTSPKWTSAKRGGKPFSVTIKFPIEFR